GVAARHVPGLGDGFTRRLVPFVHGAGLLTIAVTLTSAAPLSWAAAASLAIGGAGELLAWRLVRTAGAAHVGLAARGLAWAVAAHQLNLGTWQGPAVALLVAAYAACGTLTRRVPGVSRLFAGHLAVFVHGAAVGAVWLTLATAAPLS